VKLTLAYFRLLWRCIMNVGWRERNQRCLLSDFYLNMFQVSSCPSSWEQDHVLPHTVFCTGCAGCGDVELGHNHSQHNQHRTPYAVVHGLVLLMMGMMMPETCWDRSLIIKIWSVASCWFLSLHPYACMWDGHLIPMTIFHKVIGIKIYG